MVQTEKPPVSTDFTQRLTESNPRLKTVLDVSHDFLSREAIIGLTLPQAVEKANQLTHKVAEKLRPEGVVLREVFPGIVNALGHSLSGEGGRVVMLRHGGQQQDLETGSLKGSSQKIRMMQHEHNRKDSLTDQSLAEAAGMAVVFKALQEASGKKIVVKSSINTRAAQVAALLAEIAECEIRYDSRLDCVDYPDNLKDEAIDTLLGPTNKGGLVWEKETVNRVVGDGTFERITGDVQQIVGEGLRGGQLVINVTHTQQTNAADVMAGRSPSRLAEMGMSVFMQTPQTSFLFQNGIFQG